MSEINTQNNEKLIDKQWDGGTKFLWYDFVDWRMSKYSMLLWFVLSIIAMQIFMGNWDDYTYFQYWIYAIELLLITFAFRKSREALIFNNWKYSTFDVVFDALFSIGSLRDSSFETKSSNPISFLWNTIRMALNKYKGMKEKDVSFEMDVNIPKFDNSQNDVSNTQTKVESTWLQLFIEKILIKFSKK